MQINHGQTLTTTGEQDVVTKTTKVAFLTLCVTRWFEWWRSAGVHHVFENCCILGPHRNEFTLVALYILKTKIVSTTKLYSANTTLDSVWTHSLRSVSQPTKCFVYYSAHCKLNRCRHPRTMVCFKSILNNANETWPAKRPPNRPTTVPI
jgi:hypothetical protein